jgi:hypothetical protein
VVKNGEILREFVKNIDKVFTSSIFGSSRELIMQT